MIKYLFLLLVLSGCGKSSEETPSSKVYYAYGWKPYRVPFLRSIGAIVSELDRVFSEFGGMKPLMKRFFERYKRRAVTNEEFWHFLSSMSGINIDAYFQRYTLGGNSTLNLLNAKLDSKHPLPLSKEELKFLR